LYFFRIFIAEFIVKNKNLVELKESKENLQKNLEEKINFTNMKITESQNLYFFSSFIKKSKELMKKILSLKN